MYIFLHTKCIIIFKSIDNNNNYNKILSYQFLLMSRTDYFLILKAFDKLERILSLTRRYKNEELPI
jgi:hypothetical protein